MIIAFNVITQYLKNINSFFCSEYSSEHTYRSELQNLIQNFISSDIIIINEPNKIKCGRPDYLFIHNEIELGFIETKDIGKDLANKEYAEQFERYKNGLNNLILTNYLYFELYQNRELKISIQIAEIKDDIISPIENNFIIFEDLINHFIHYKGQSITSPLQLAKLMAGKAKLFAYVIREIFSSDSQTQFLNEQIDGFKEVLLHDIEPAEFADIYAQTIAYGFFIASFHNHNAEHFSRKKAARLIPLTNPFLKKLFSLIEKENLDKRITWVIDSLVTIFLATKIDKIEQQLKNSGSDNDPIIHFYETFLTEYNPELRKSRGVWYTPQPVVNFIIRAVDDILKTDFNLADGLADSGKATFEITIEKKIKPQLEELHRVQILDPATGTGTFLAETIKHIHQTKAQLNQKEWSDYIER
ncbi:MAG: hypothetical protein RL637_1675, partial [Pseudomonadota bacterium]